MTVFDIETDGLLEDLTKIHVVSYMREDMQEPVSIFDYEEMREFFLNEPVLCGHNIIRYDIPAVEKVLGVSPRGKLVDTLPLSWYLNHSRVKHGLEGYGEEFGVPKPKVDDWHNLTPEEYAHRCSEDVKINMRLWKQLKFKLSKLYGQQSEEDRLIEYLNFKMQCAAEQERLGWRLDVERAQQCHDELLMQQEEKIKQLSEAMPKRVITKKVSQPKVMNKKDGSLSSHGERWVALCKENKMPVTCKEITVVAGYEDANPNSNDQVKDWLHSLGWKPKTYKFVRDKNTGKERKIEQVRKDGVLCDSVVDLSDTHPSVSLLEGLTVIQHRLGIFKGFLESHRDGWLKAEVAGLTNTFRFKHMKPLVNLPGVDKPWGEEIRGCLLAPDDDHVLCGADMVSLEDTTKRHYMKPLDPDYVEEMCKPGFDPHLDLAKFAGAVTQEDIDAYNRGEKPEIKSLRKAYKVVNYSATYGVGAAKLARETGMTTTEAEKLLENFWKRNWSVDKVAKSQVVRELSGEMWMKNPVSGFWHSLRSDKDRFSTLNQSTGVYCFDSWVIRCRKLGIKTVGQFHDEIIAIVKKGEESQIGSMMEKAISQVNDTLNLNVSLGVDYTFGKNYAEVH